MPGSNSAAILYGSLGPRADRTSQVETTEVYRSLKSTAQRSLVALAFLKWRQDQAGSDYPNGHSAYSIFKLIDEEEASIQRTAQIMSNLERRGLVKGIQGRDMARVQWLLTDSGRDSLPVSECSICRMKTPLHQGVCHHCRIPLPGWDEIGISS